MKVSISAPRGTKDILPGEVEKWNYVEETVRDRMRIFGYKEIRTPVIESAELFERGVGSEEDIVKKEMYVFQDRSGRNIALRPEGTASVVRAYVQQKMSVGQELTKLYYITPMFRYERPQAGRYRQHHQFGAEAIGGEEPGIDAEIIMLALDIAKRLGLRSAGTKINSIGCRECRPKYVKELGAFLKGKVGDLCEECGERMGRNPIRVLDCKREECDKKTEEIPKTVDFLCGGCKEHYGRLKKYLDVYGIKYEEEKRLVRGLDYYTRTTFEVVDDALGAQNSVVGGGRYDDLVEELGGEPTPAVGFGAGIERIILALEAHGVEFPERRGPQINIATLDEESFKTGLKLLKDFRERSIAADIDYSSRGLRGKLKRANREGAVFVIIIGEDERESGEATLKNFETGEQEKIAIEKLVDHMQDKV